MPEVLAHYLRSSEVTEFVQAHRGGTYSVTGVPATQETYVDDLNADAPQVGVRRLAHLLHDVVALAGDHVMHGALAELDVLASFAERAETLGYCAPEFTDEPLVDIVQGRHPVVEQRIEEPFVANEAVVSSNLIIRPINRKGCPQDSLFGYGKAELRFELSEKRV